MSDIRSKPYSKYGQEEWERIFRSVEPPPSPSVSGSTWKAFDDLGIVTSAPEAIRVLRTATKRTQVQALRHSARLIVEHWVEGDRINFWREFNAAVPQGLE
jgi:hypothetical protein